MRTKVFISESAFTAFIDRANPRHLQAKAYFRYFGEAGFTLFTSPLTLDKVYQKLSKNISPSIARDFLKAINLGTINILYLDDTDMKLVAKFFQANQNFEIEFDDAVTGALCYRHNIPEVCTFSYLHSIFGVTQFYLPV